MTNRGLSVYTFDHDRQPLWRSAELEHLRCAGEVCILPGLPRDVHADHVQILVGFFSRFDGRLAGGFCAISLFLGRLAYRVTALVVLARGEAQDSALSFDPGSIQLAQGTSMTVAIVLILVGYYVCYYTGVLLRLGTPEPA